MTTKCIVLHRPDGGITIRHPAPHARLVKVEGGDPVPLSQISTKIDPADPSIQYAETEDEFLERVRTSARRHKNATGHDIVEAAVVPADITFRDAWSFDGKQFGVKMDEAKEIWRDRLRKEREPLLAALDVEFIRALEAGADTKAIAAEKQRLRDVTALPAIDAAQTPDELKAIRARRP